MAPSTKRVFIVILEGTLLLLLVINTLLSHRLARQVGVVTLILSLTLISQWGMLLKSTLLHPPVRLLGPKERTATGSIQGVPLDNSCARKSSINQQDSI